MTGSISDFKSSFRNEPAKPNRFDVSIPVPLALIPFRNTARNLSFRCERANLPSRSFATIEQKYGANPTEKYPYISNYNDMDLTFIVTDSMEEKLFFDAWMEYIQPSYRFDFRYKKDYVTTMQVNQYDYKNKLIYSVNLIDAYPIVINQMDLDWSSTDFHRLTVSFAYTYWQNNSIQAIGTSLLQSGISQITAGLTNVDVSNAEPTVGISEEIIVPPVPQDPGVQIFAYGDSPRSALTQD